MNTPPPKPLIAIACGGTGGHLFPGLAVAQALQARNCGILLLISPKDVDQQAIKSAHDVQVCTLPACGLTRGQLLRFAFGFVQSFRAAKKLFRSQPPQAVLATGGFTSVAPILAGKMSGAGTFLHESNTAPGKANRWLAHFVDHAFIGFPSAANRLSTRKVMTTGTPVRPEFAPGDPAAARIALGLRPERPVLLVMGGSQGASGVNQLVMQALPELRRAAPELQYFHLTGDKEFKKVLAQYHEHNCPAIIRPFLTEMELAMSAATIAVTRAGASTLAELAAMRLPPILIPFPAAADNHQLFNARAVADTGAALLLEQKDTTSEKMAQTILSLIHDTAALDRMKDELIRWHSPRAAEQMAEKILLFIRPLVPDLGLDESRQSGHAGSVQMSKARHPSVAA